MKDKQPKKKKALVGLDKTKKKKPTVKKESKPAAEVIPLQPAGPIELTLREANKLALEQQMLKIRMIENALQYQVAGVSHLYGQPIDNGHLIRAKNDLARLDRERLYFEKHPNYMPCNAARVQKITSHFDENGSLTFIEVKPTTTGDAVKAHLSTKSHIVKSIKNKQMATKKKAAKKGALKKAAKKVAPKKAVKKSTTKTEGDSIRARVDKLVAAGKDNAAIMEALDKEGIVYSIKSVRWYASKARSAK